MESGHQGLPAFGARRLVGRRAGDVPQRRPPRLRSLLENAGPAIAQERLVSLGRAVGGLPHRPSAESATAGRFAEILDEWRGKRLVLIPPIRFEASYRLNTLGPEQ